jgi:serine/threonine protein kinase
MSDLISSPLGDYRVEGAVGQTVIGTMYRGAHIHLRTPVTIVVVDNRYASAAGFKARLIQYAQQIVGFADPHVVGTFLTGEHMGLNYIVMEHVEGGELKARPGASEWSSANWQAVALIQQAAQGLAAAQVRGLSHGDVKLSNLLLTKQDLATAHVKVSEIGLRQLAGEPAVSSDLAGLGGALYEAVTGRPAAHASRGEFPSGTPEELKTVVRRCLSDDARLRFASCDELARLLARLSDEWKAAASKPAPHAVTDPAVPRPEPIKPVAPEGWGDGGVGVRTGAKPPEGPKTRWDPPAHPEPLPAGDLVPCLHVYDDSKAPVAKQFVRGKIAIGRDPSNTIVLPHGDVSGSHARIEWDGHERITITDLTSRNGTKYKNESLLPEVPQDWGEEQWVKIASYWLCLQRPRKGVVTDGAIEVILDPQSQKMELTPGRPAQCRLTLVNRKTTVEQIALSVQGIPSEWVQVLGDKQPRVMAYQRAEVTLSITVPRSSSATAGDYAVTVVARPVRSSDATGSATAQWTVLPFEEVSVAMSPSKSGGLRRARYNLTLQHGGNFPASYVVTGADDERQLEYLFSADDAVDRRKLELKDLPPGSKNVKLQVNAGKRWFGSSKGFPFVIQAVPVEAPAKQTVTTEGQFTHRAIFPIWMMAVAPLLLLAVLFALPSMFRPVIRSVYIEPERPQVDQQFDVSWEASRARRVRIFANDIPVRPEPDPDVTRYAFQKGLPKDTRVRVLVSNLFGEASREITVSPTPLPEVPVAAAVIEVFTVTPQSIGDPNQQVQIRWRASGASRVELTPIGSVETEGNTSHTPGAEQSYTLTAFNKLEKPTTRTLTVRFREPEPRSEDLFVEVISPGRKDQNGVTIVRVDREPLILRWSAARGKELRLQSRGSAAPVQGSSGEKSAMLLGVGTYTFTLIASTSQGGSVASKAVTVQATCDRRWFEPILTAGLAGCKKPPQVQWQQ